MIPPFRKNANSSTSWSSIKLIAFVFLLTRIQFTVYFASLWPFLQEIQSDVTPREFAYVNAAYSIGIAGAAPMFGWWSNKLGSIRIPTLVYTSLMLVANSLYLFLHLLPEYGSVMMAAARFLVGVAAGGNSLLPTYWTYAAAPKDRTTAAAMYDSAFCIGMALGPAFQFLFSYIGYPGWQYGILQLNMYTVPVIVANALVLVAIVLVLFCFDESPMYQKKNLDTDSDDVAPERVVAPFDKVAAFLCILTKMIQMFVYANMETIGSMYTQRMFGLTRTQTTQFNSVLVSLSGLLGFFFLIGYIYTKLAKKVENRIGTMCGICVCLLFLIATYSWDFYPDNIKSEICPESWCETTSRIPLYVYVVAYVLLFGVGFSLTNVHVAALFSLVLGPRRQGLMHGMNTLLASCSRVLGPFAVTDLFAAYGPRIAWKLQLGVWLVLILSLSIFWKRLVPLKQSPPANVKTDNEEKDKVEDNDLKPKETKLSKTEK